MRWSLKTPWMALSVLLLVVLTSSVAQASWLQPHTRQEAVPLADVERSLVVGKSWMLVDFGFSWKHSDSHFIGDRLFNLGATEGTHYEPENNEGQWDYRKWTLGLTWGFSRNSQLSLRVPIIWASAWNNRMMDGDERKPLSSVGLGDMHGGFRYQWLRSQSDDGRFSNSLVTGLEMRFPTGHESPGSYIGGPNNVPTIITGAGTWGFDLYARFKQQMRFFAVEVGLGYQLNPVNVVMYLVDTEEDQFNQHLDPGDVIHTDLGLTVQFFRHLALRGNLYLDYRLASKWGSTSASFPPCKDCLTIPDSNGFWMDVDAKLIATIDSHFGMDAYFRYTLAGRHNFLWPLEDLSPSRGWTAGGNLSYRF